MWFGFDTASAMVQKLNTRNVYLRTDDKRCRYGWPFELRMPAGESAVVLSFGAVSFAGEAQRNERLEMKGGMFSF